MNSSEIDDICNWTPANLKNVFFQLTLTIGCRGHKSGNDFQLLIAARNQNHVQRSQNDKAITQWFDDYSFAALEEHLNSIVSGCSRNSRDHCVDKLRKFMPGSTKITSEVKTGKRRWQGGNTPASPHCSQASNSLLDMSHGYSG
ncbi:MAG: hypothetical protein GY927_08850 [bacterium]|nr:hypothetical protein [bacterium]